MTIQSKTFFLGFKVCLGAALVPIEIRWKETVGDEFVGYLVVFVGNYFTSHYFTSISTPLLKGMMHSTEFFGI